VTTLTFSYNLRGCSGTKTVNQNLTIGVAPNPTGPAGGTGFGYTSANPVDPTFVFIGGTFTSGATAEGFAAYYSCTSTGTSAASDSLSWTAAKR
jgi:hypothetical protein